MSQEERIRFVALKLTKKKTMLITPGHKEEALSTCEGTEFWLVKCRIHSCPVDPQVLRACVTPSKATCYTGRASLYGNLLCFPPIPRLNIEVTIQQPCLLECMQGSIDLCSLLLSLLGMIHGILSPLCASAVNQQKLTCIRLNLTMTIVKAIDLHHLYWPSSKDSNCNL